jgi:hypothetical protein
MLAHPQPAFLRARASSYDAPAQTSPPNQPGRLAALAQVIPSGAQVDGTAAASSTAARLDTMAGDHSMYTAEEENMPHSSSTNSLSKNTPYNNPSLNNSAPVLAHPASVQMAARSVTGPVMKRNISFAQNLSVHVTWPGNIYDRRGEPATCNRLTPQLAQRIKEELNAFKMEEMEVVSHFIHPLRLSETVMLIASHSIITVAITRTSSSETSDSHSPSFCHRAHLYRRI